MPARSGAEVGTAAARWRRRGVGTLVGTFLLVACSHTSVAAPPTSVASTSTTSTTLAAISSLMVDGVRPGVLQAPFYPQVTVTTVSCGVVNGKRFVRVDVPAGAPGTTAKSVLTMPTAVFIAPGAAVLVDPRFLTRILYAENMKSVAVATQGSFVLTMQNVTKTGGDGLSVQVGNVRVIGDYECPATDVAYPGT